MSLKTQRRTRIASSDVPLFARQFFARLFIIIALFTASAPWARAASIIVGGSGLLTQGGADQLAAWLGEGDLTLTGIFSHAAGDGKTSLGFHAAADGIGRTFSVLEVTNVNGSAADLLVGGYNPRSWDSSNSTYFATALADRTAFLFNLSAGTRLAERLDGGGEYHTNNFASLGPDFGGGDDLAVDSSLNAGYANAFSYTPQLIGGVRSTSLTYSHLEVFTIAPVPEPSCALLLAAAGASTLLCRRRSRTECLRIGDGVKME
jgi:hypothetical protein